MAQGAHDGRHERQQSEIILKRSRQMKRVNKDCPFTIEELDEFRAMLYSVNTSFHCCNAAPVDWAAGWQRNEIRERNKHQ